MNNDNGGYDTFFDPDLVMPPIRNHNVNSTKQAGPYAQLTHRAATLSTYSGDNLVANPRRSYSIDRSLPSAERLIASLYDQKNDRTRVCPEPQQLHNTTFVDAMPIHRPAILTGTGPSAYDKILKDPSKRQRKTMDAIDKESLIDEIQTLRKQKNALEELSRKQQTRIARLEELLKSRDKELQNLARIVSTGIPDPTKVSDMMALKQKETAPTMDYVRGLKHKLKEYYVHNQDLLGFIERLKESMNFQRMKQLEKNLLIYYDKYNQLRVKNGALNQHCIELEEELGAVHDKMIQSLRSKKYPGMRMSEDNRENSTPSTASSKDSKNKGPSAHASLLMGAKVVASNAEPDGRFLSDTFDVSNVVPSGHSSGKAIQDQLNKHSMAMQTSMLASSKKPSYKTQKKDTEKYDPVAELTARFYENKLERERRRLECSFVPDVPEPLEQVEYKILEDELDEFIKAYRNKEPSIHGPRSNQYVTSNLGQSGMQQGGNMILSRDTGVKQAQSKNERLAQRLVTEIKRSEAIPAATVHVPNSLEPTSKSSPVATDSKREDNPYFAQKQHSKDHSSEKPTSVSGNRPYEDTDNGSTICDWNSSAEPDMVSRVGVTMTELTSAGGPRQRPKTPLSETSGLGGDSKPSRNPNSFYPNPPFQDEKTIPNRNKFDLDSKNNCKVDSDVSPENEMSKNNAEEPKIDSFHKGTKDLIQDVLSSDSLDKLKVNNELEQTSGIVSLESSSHAIETQNNVVNIVDASLGSFSDHKQMKTHDSPTLSQSGNKFTEEQMHEAGDMPSKDSVTNRNDPDVSDGALNDSLNKIITETKPLETVADDVNLTSATFDSGIEENSIYKKFPLTDVSQAKPNSTLTSTRSIITTKEDVNDDLQNTSENQTTDLKSTIKDYSSLVLDSHMFDDPKTTNETPRDGTKDYSSLQLYSGMFDGGNAKSTGGPDSVREYSSLHLHSAMFDEPQASKSHPLQNSGDYSSLQLYSGMFDAQDDEPEKPRPPTPPQEVHYPANPKIKIIESSGTESTAFTIEGTEPSALKAYSQSHLREDSLGPRVANPFQKLQLENQEVAFSHQHPIAEESSFTNSSASHQNPQDGGEY